MRNFSILLIFILSGLFIPKDVNSEVNLFGNFLYSEPDSLSSGNEKTNKLTIESDFNSQYLWRGINFQDALIWNPNVTYNIKKFSANVWANIPIHFYDIADKEFQNFNESDINLNYEIEKEVSYTMITHSAQCYTPLGKGDWYWGLVNVFQGFYKGDIGIYVNPEIAYYPFKGGVFFETGLNYNHESDKSVTAIYLAYSTANKIFTKYNVSGGDEGTYTKPFQSIKFDLSYQYNFRGGYVRPHFTYFYMLNYTDVLGYKNAFAFGLALGHQKNLGGKSDFTK